MPGQRPRRRVQTRDRKPSWGPVLGGYLFELVFWLGVGAGLVQIWQIGLRTYDLDRQWRSKQTRIARLEQLQRAWDEKRAMVETKEGLELSIREQGYLKPGERWLRFEDLLDEPWSREAGTTAPEDLPGHETARRLEELLSRIGRESSPESSGSGK